MIPREADDPADLPLSVPAMHRELDLGFESKLGLTPATAHVDVPGLLAVAHDDEESAGTGFQERRHGRPRGLRTVAGDPILTCLPGASSHLHTASTNGLFERLAGAVEHHPEG